MEEHESGGPRPSASDGEDETSMVGDDETSVGVDAPPRAADAASEAAVGPAAFPIVRDMPSAGLDEPGDGVAQPEIDEVDDLDDEGAGPSRRPRRLRRFLVASIIAAVLIGPAVAAALSYQRGTDWQDRTHVRDARIAELERSLAASEEDVASLTDRIDELTADKSNAETERDGALNTASFAAELTRLSALVATDLEACVDGTQDLMDVIIDIWAYDSDSVMSYAGEVGSICGRARASNDLLQDLIEGDT